MDKKSRLRKRHAVLVAWRHAIQEAHRRGEAPPDRHRKQCQQLWEALQREISDGLTSATHRKARLERERAQLIERAASGKGDVAKINALGKGLLEAIRQCDTEIESLSPLAQSTVAGAPPEPLPLEVYPVRYRQACGTLWERLSQSDRISLSLAAAVVIACVLFVLLYHDFGQRPQFQIEAPRGPESIAVVHCTNPLSDPVLLHVPWPVDGPAAEDQNGLNVGVQIYARAKESEEFKPWNSAVEAWTYEGQPTANRPPLEIAPGITLHAFLHVPLLGAEAQEIEALEIRCTNGRGKVLARMDFPASP